MISIEEIKEKAQGILDEKEKERLVSRYLDLLEIKKQTQKQLEKIEKSIKQFEDNPESFCDRTEDLWWVMSFDYKKLENFIVEHRERFRTQSAKTLTEFNRENRNTTKENIERLNEKLLREESRQLAKALEKFIEDEIERRMNTMNGEIQSLKNQVRELNRLSNSFLTRFNDLDNS